MKIFASLLLGTLMTIGGAQAGTITDSGSTAYWGGNNYGLGDVIGGSLYDISSATLKLNGTVLTINIATSFAGHAGADTWAAAKGIGYGDVFLAPAWNPSGADDHHANDNAATGTLWKFGLVLDDRWNNTGGALSLYALNGASNAANIANSESFLSCAVGTQCYYRTGQATAVKTASSSVQNTGATGTWSVAPDAGLTFSIDVKGTALAGYSNMALHWGETCQNDVIEGVTKVPEPASILLVAAALAGLGLRRRAR